MLTLEETLERRLSALERDHLRRVLPTPAAAQGVRFTTAGQSFLNFSSNDYLGLAGHPAVVEAASRAALEAGAGAGASRLVCGSLTIHEKLETDLAAFKGVERALAFSSGYATALGVIPALVGPRDFVVLDRLAHASLIDAARLSGARLRVFRHNDIEDLERILRWVAAQPGVAPSSDRGNALIVTESVFSMDGDRAPLREMANLKDQYGAWLFVDEAHATGFLGPGRRGWVEELGLTSRVEVAMGTLGKALGSAGGFIAGSQTLIDFLVNWARSFIFSTAPPPAVAAAASTALAIVASEEGAGLAARMWDLVRSLHAGLAQAGWTLPPPTSPILSLVLGAEEGAMRVSTALRAEGILVPGIRFPTVPRGRARLRVTVGATHRREDVQQLVDALARAMRRMGISPS